MVGIFLECPATVTGQECKKQWRATVPYKRGRRLYCKVVGEYINKMLAFLVFSSRRPPFGAPAGRRRIWPTCWNTLFQQCTNVHPFTGEEKSVPREGIKVQLDWIKSSAECRHLISKLVPRELNHNYFITFVLLECSLLQAPLSNCIFRYTSLENRLLKQ
jgi:hypothetical protein